MAPRFKAVIFDFDGTLFWNGPQHEAAWLALLGTLAG
jgi:beta-phosphoglucomutase-like phosphatase (HAD superfamily)